MSLPADLTPLLHPGALFSIARQLVAARERLSLRTGGNLPNAVQLALALHLHMQQSDERRLRRQRERPPLVSLPPSDSPPLDLVAYMLEVSDVTYKVFEPRMLARSLKQIHLQPPLESRARAEQFHPGYVLVHDPINSALLLAVRGSREVGDLLTNISVDALRFLGGYAHEGIARSAINLHALLRPVMADFIMRKELKITSLYIVGHSLGGAVASALTMLLHATELPPNEPTRVSRVLTSARCFSFSPPPFVSPSLAALSRRYPITTWVYNLDLVPRLSAASIDRLMTCLANLDTSPSPAHFVASAAAAVVPPLFPDESASAGREWSQRGATSALDTVSGSVLALASSALGVAPVQHTARDGAARRSESTTDLLGNLLHTVFFASSTGGGAAAAATAGGDSAREAPALAQSTSQVARRRAAPNALVRSRTYHGEAPGAGASREVVLAGTVWHVECDFQPVPDGDEHDAHRAQTEVRLVRRDGEYFRDIAASAWMMIDHNPRSLRQALELLQT